MSRHDLATKADLVELREAAQADIAQMRADTKSGLAELRAATTADMLALEEQLDAKMDIKLEYFAKKIVEDMSGVLSDMMAQIDDRFMRLETAVFRPSFRRWN